MNGALWVLILIVLFILLIGRGPPDGSQGYVAKG